MTQELVLFICALFELIVGCLFIAWAVKANKKKWDERSENFLLISAFIWFLIASVTLWNVMNIWIGTLPHIPGVSK